VAGLDVAHLVNADPVAVLVVGGDRGEQVADVVAEIVALADLAGEPARAGIEQRDAARPGSPGAACELVDVVAGLPAEELHERRLRARDEVDGEREMQARKRGGSKLVCVAKPTTQPARRSPSAQVTMRIGGSIEPMMLRNVSETSASVTQRKLPGVPCSRALGS
jgi:hypothetical protein